MTPRQNIAIAVAAFAVYTALAIISLWVVVPGTENSSPVFLAAGFACWVMTVWPRAGIVGVYAGAWAANVYIVGPGAWDVALLGATGNAGGALAFAAVMHRYQHRVKVATDVLLPSTTAAILAAGVSALIGPTVYGLDVGARAAWFFGDLAGICLITPQVGRTISAWQRRGSAFWPMEVWASIEAQAYAGLVFLIGIALALIGGMVAVWTSMPGP